MADKVEKFPDLKEGIEKYVKCKEDAATESAKGKEGAEVHAASSKRKGVHEVGSLKMVDKNTVLQPVIPKEKETNEFVKLTSAEKKSVAQEAHEVLQVQMKDEKNVGHIASIEDNKAEGNNVKGVIRFEPEEDNATKALRELVDRTTKKKIQEIDVLFDFFEILLYKYRDSGTFLDIWMSSNRQVTSPLQMIKDFFSMVHTQDSLHFHMKQSVAELIMHRGLG